MDLGLRGRRALITASSRGIGYACAMALASEGASVVVCARDAAAVASAVDAAGGPPAGHAGIVTDLLRAGEPERVAALALAGGPIDVVVHNLGGTLGVRDALGSPIEAWDRVWRANLGVAIELNAVLVPRMIAAGWGRVVSIGSVAGVEHHGALPYATAKAAVAAYVRGLGRELAATGVVVCGVHPGTVLTPGGVWDQRRTNDPAAVETYIRERLPAGRFQTPESVADVVTFLCSDRAAEFAGAMLSVDGGQQRAFST
jgi:3-oxoacyl-[acyl-carrier protein] reductase